MAYITPGECAGKYRWNTWDIIRHNVTGKDRLYDYDEYWSELRGMCARDILPYLDDTLLEMGVDINAQAYQNDKGQRWENEDKLKNEIDIRQQRLAILEDEATTINTYQKKIQDPPNWTAIGIAAGFGLFAGFLGLNIIMK